MENRVTMIEIVDDLISPGQYLMPMLHEVIADPLLLFRQTGKHLRPLVRCSIRHYSLLLVSSGLSFKPLGALDDIPWPLPDLFVNPPDVLPQYANADQLNTAKKQHEYNDGRISKREWETENFENGIQHTDTECRECYDKAS